MRVFITGGSGFVGRALCRALMAAGHQVTVLARSPRSQKRLPKGVRIVTGDPSKPGDWQEQAEGCQGFVNLAGANIFARWTRRYKQRIGDSRVRTTLNLAAAMSKTSQAQVLVSASAVGYYGFRGDEVLDETAGPGFDFLARVCEDWEASARRAAQDGTRVVLARFGIVLDHGGGALGKMLPLFKLGLGGRLGSGRQWFSWIHREDLAAGIVHCLENPDISGPVNLTAPNPVTNRELARELGRVLHKPAWLPVPGFVVRMAMGELGQVLLNGQRVVPRVLVDNGFRFKYPTLGGALARILT